MGIVRSPYQTGLKWASGSGHGGSGCGSWISGPQAMSRLWKAGPPFCNMSVLSTKCGDLRTNCGKSMDNEKMKVFKIRKMSAINSI